MVSYFIPRGRFLIKAGHLRQIHQKHQQQQQHEEKWAIFRQFRRSLSSNKTFTANVNNLSSSKENETKDSKANVNTCHSNISRHDESVSNDSSISRRRIIPKDRRSGWSNWTGFLFRWAPIGFCIFGGVEWQLHKQKCKKNELPRTASDFQSKIYRSLPLRLLSRWWGWIASCYIPISLRPYIYGWYSCIFNVNIDEALHSDYKYYNSLAEFFTRPIRDDVRPIDQHATLVSPADGRILHFGSATNSLIEQVKGVNYSIRSFLGPANWDDSSKDSIEEYDEAIKEKHDGTTTLYQCVIYLAPGDYHRFHSPAQWEPKLRRHFSGELLSVNPTVAQWLPGLFCLNERALYLGSWQHGFFSYTAVGATNVGSVEIFVDENLKTNRWIGLNVGTHKKHEEYEEMKLDCPKPFSKGDLFGQFNMGSTIVLVFEAPKNFQFNIEAGQKIRVGEPLGVIS